MTNVFVSERNYLCVVLFLRYFQSIRDLKMKKIYEFLLYWNLAIIAAWKIMSLRPLIPIDHKYKILFRYKLHNIYTSNRLFSVLIISLQKKLKKKKKFFKIIFRSGVRVECTVDCGTVYWVFSITLSGVIFVSSPRP